MQAFKVSMKIIPKQDFEAEKFKKRIIKSLGEVNYNLLSFNYQKGAEEQFPEIPTLNRKLDICECLVEMTNSFDYRVVLGSFAEAYTSNDMDVPSVKPDFVEIN